MNRFVIIAFIFISCTKKDSENFSIQGRIFPVKIEYLILKQQTDIERLITTTIDTIFVLKNGEFKTDKILEPHLYTLQIGTKNSIDLAIDKGQHLTININNDKLEIIGSKDTDDLRVYENFRKKSLDSLVQSVRRQVKKIKGSKHPDDKEIFKLEQLENARQAHLFFANAQAKA